MTSSQGTLGARSIEKAATAKATVVAGGTGGESDHLGHGFHAS
jgi:hypothetical protein